MNQNAKFGYVVTSTTGLIEEGFSLLNVESFKTGEIDAASPYPVDESPVAVFATCEAAEKAIDDITPPGKHPAVWAGLDVKSAYEVAIDYLFEAETHKGMDGFSVPCVKSTI